MPGERTEISLTDQDYLEQLEGARTYVDRVKAQVESGRLAQRHLEHAQNFLKGWETNRSVQGALARHASGQRTVLATTHLLTPEVPPQEKIQLWLDIETHQITRGEQSSKKLTQVQFALINEFVLKPGQSLSIDEITKIAKANFHRAKYPARDLVKNVNKGFRELIDGKNLILRTGTSKNSRYSINPLVQLSSAQETARPVPTTSVDKPVETNRITKHETKLLEVLGRGSAQQPVSRQEIIDPIYPGVSTKVAADRLSVLLSKLRRKLKSQGMEIVNTRPRGGSKNEASYFIKTTTSDLSQKAGRDLAGGLIASREPIIVSYEPSEDKLKNKTRKQMFIRTNQHDN